MKRRTALACLLLALLVALAALDQAHRRLEARAGVLLRQRADARMMRGRIDALNRSTERLQRARGDEIQAQQAARQQRLAATTPALTEGFVSAQNLKDLGNASPADAAESYLWALRTGDIAALKRLFLFEPASLAEIRSWWDSLPASARAPYGDPVDLFLSLYTAQQTLAPWVGVRVSDDPLPAGATYTGVNADYEYADGRVRQHSVYPVVWRTPTGWRLYGYSALVASVIKQFESPPPARRWNDE